MKRENNISHMTFNSIVVVVTLIMFIIMGYDIIDNNEKIQKLETRITWIENK
jgi:ammonia channel protein AmtB